MQITKIQNFSRKLTWKWENYTKFEGKGYRRSKFNNEEIEFLCEKAIGKKMVKMEYHPEI